MSKANTILSSRRYALLALLLVFASCAKQSSTATHSSFATPEEATTALVAALGADDLAQLGQLLGPGSEPLLGSGDEVAARAARQAFLERYRAGHRIVTGGRDVLALQVGEDDWPLPIPLVRKDGRWQFDGAAGVDELLIRRIGANELRTIDVMRGFVAAQEEYAASEHDGVPAGTYAQRLRSQPGKQDGLYWAVAAGETPSPAGPFLADAEAEGYDATGSRQPYHGYVYKLLYAQGAAANGGAREYRNDGQLTGGFALLAWPSAYDTSGVMTFMVNQDGVVWQRDLGSETAHLAADMQNFNPDENWAPLAPEG